MPLPFSILLTDRRFATHAEEGEPGLFSCSRQNSEPIVDHDMAIRAWPSDGRYELRYHATCLGFESALAWDVESEND